MFTYHRHYLHENMENSAKKYPNGINALVKRKAIYSELYNFFYLHY